MSEEDDDDWFERALQDLGEDEEADDVETPSESDATDDAEGGDVESGDADGDTARSDDGEVHDAGLSDLAEDRDVGEDAVDAADTDTDAEMDDAGADTDADGEMSADTDVSESPSDSVPDAEQDPFGGVREDEPPEGREFDDGFAGTDETDAESGERSGGFDAGDAGGFTNAPSPGSEPEEDEGAGPGDQSPFVDPGPGPGESDEEDPFGGFDGSGGGQFGESGGADDGFAGGGGDEFGFADFGGGGDSGGAGGSAAFDEESFESDIERIRIGVEGLDEMILGGVPRRSLISVIGSAGTGKSTLALQFLHEALRSGERAVYITLEESREAILDTAEEKGWSFRQYEEEGLLAVVPLDPIEMANSLASIRNDLTRLISEFGAERLVLDSVSLLEMMYDTPAKRRSEVFDFTRSLKEAGVTTLVTSEASEEHAYTSRYGLVEYLTDAVFILQYVRPDDFRETRLAVEIQKIRDANHSRETKPYEITDDGISVYRQANIF